MYVGVRGVLPILVPLALECVEMDCMMRTMDNPEILVLYVLIDRDLPMNPLDIPRFSLSSMQLFHCLPTL